MSGTTLPPISTYRLVSKNETAEITQFQKTDAQTKSDIAYFTKVAPSLTTPAKLLANYRALSVVLGAFGMSTNAGQTALIRQFLTQDPTNPKSAAQKIGNPLYLRFASAMKQMNPNPLTNPAGVQAIVTAVSTNNFEAAQDVLSPGVANALYFKRTVASATSLARLMSDPKLLAVATVATNMPDNFGSLDYAAQVKLLGAKIKITDFQSPTKVDQFVTKYLAIQQASSNTVADPSGALASLTGSGSAGDVLSNLFPQTTAATSGASLLSLFA